MHIAKSALDRIGSAVIGRQKNGLKRGSSANHCSTLAGAAPAIGPGDVESKFLDEKVQEILGAKVAECFVEVLREISLDRTSHARPSLLREPDTHRIPATVFIHADTFYRSFPSSLTQC
jgi:hypothetical protein